MSGYPNLKGVATSDLLSQVQAGSYSADYINWSRTMQLLRDHAPGWLPEMLMTPEGTYVHQAGIGGFLLIRFVHEDGRVTPAMPQAIMDNRNNAIPFEKITARDVTDTHRRGLCMAAALAFGLAYELWAKMELESGQPQPQETVRPFDPDRDLLPGAISGKDARSRITRALMDIEPSVAWGDVLDHVAPGWRDMEGNAGTDFWRRLANLVARLSEEHLPGSFPSPDEKKLQTAFAEMFSGLVVEIVYKLPESPLPDEPDSTEEVADADQGAAPDAS